MASLFGDAFTNLALGAVKQADTNWDDAASAQANLMKQRQAMVDKVAAEQQKMEEKAADVAQKQQSYVQMYGIDPDMAYGIATNPNVEKMKADELADYIKSLKPTGQRTPATPATQGTTINPGIQQDKGVVNQILSGPNINVPPVQGVSRPAQPSRQIYSPDGNYISGKDQRALLERSMELAHGCMGAFRSAYQAGGGDMSRLPANFSLPRDRSADAADRANRNAEFEHNRQVMDVIVNKLGTGEITKAQVPGILRLYGMDPNKVNMNDLDGIVATKKAGGGEKAQEIEDNIPHIVASFPGIGPEDAKAMATSMVRGDIKWVNDPQNNRNYLINTANNQVLNDTSARQYINALHRANQALGHVPTDRPIPFPDVDNVPGAHTPSTVAPGPTPGSDGDVTTINATKTGATAPSPKYDFTPAPPTGMPRQEWQQTQERMSEAPKMLANINYAMALANKDPGAIGLRGQIIKHVGGPMVNFADLFSHSGADSLDKYLQVGDRHGVQTAFDGLTQEMARPLWGAYIPSGSIGMSSGGKNGVEAMRDMFEHGDYHSLLSGLQSSSDVIKNTFLTNYALDYRKTHPNLPYKGPDGSPNTDLINGLGEELMNQGFAKDDAVSVIRKIFNVSSGKGPK